MKDIFMALFLNEYVVPFILLFLYICGHYALYLYAEWKVKQIKKKKEREQNNGK